MKAKMLFVNGPVHTQSHGLVVNSMAVYKNRIVGIGNNLQHDPDFRSYTQFDLKGKMIAPGFVDAHTHFHYFALSLSRLSLDGVDSLDKCLALIKQFSSKLKKNEWVVGEGYSPDRFRRWSVPDRLMLDAVTGGRPAFFFSKDQHSAWVNSRALELAGLDTATPDPVGGRIEHFDDGTPSGILREGPAYGAVYDCIKQPSEKKVDKLYRQALDIAYRKGLTGVHSMDGPEGFAYLAGLAEQNKVGLRINYYHAGHLVDELLEQKIYYGTGTEFFRIAGIKMFADGALGSQTGLCFNKYIGSKNNSGIEVTPARELLKRAKKAARLGLPCAIHAIGDKAVANVLDVFEQMPLPSFGARHRIEHVQLLRRKDIKRFKKLGVVASMQPSHCPSDIKMMRKYWGSRDRNAFVFRSFIDSGVELAFGSDCPIEPLDPIGGIAAAVRRAVPGSRDIFNAEQRITAAEALYAFTAGAATAAGEEHCRGRLLPDYPADFVILSDDITKVAAGRIYDIDVLATILNGSLKYVHDSLRM